jgi:hypothetical protein
MSGLIRVAQIILALFLAVTAVGGGVALLAGVNTPPVAMLSGSLFTSFLLPGLALLALVGGTASVAAVLLVRRHPQAPDAAFLAAILIITFETVEIAVIGAPEGVARNLQVFYYALGVAMAALAWGSRMIGNRSRSI